LDRVRTLASHGYSRYQDRLLAANNDLRDRMMLSAFELDPVRAVAGPYERPSITGSEVDLLEGRVMRFLSQAPGAGRSSVRTRATDQIRAFFTALRHTVVESGPSLNGDTDDLVTSAVRAQQFHKVQTLIRDFERYEESASTAYDEIGTYLEVV